MTARMTTELPELAPPGRRRRADPTLQEMFCGFRICLPLCAHAAGCKTWTADQISGAIEAARVAQDEALRRVVRKRMAELQLRAAVTEPAPLDFCDIPIDPV